MLKPLLIIVAIFFSNLSLAASDGQNALINTSQRWLDAKWIELTIKDNQNDWLGNWHIAFDHPSNSVQIDKDDLFNGQHLQGSLIVLDGKSLLAKGLNLKPGYEIDALDTPILMTQLLLSLLEKSAATQPSSLKSPLRIQHQESTLPIRVATKSASAFFQTPWQVNGELNKLADQNIHFDLEFQTTLGENINYIVYMTGKLNHHQSLPWKNDTTLAGWEIYLLGPESDNQFSYGAKKIKSSATTIGELRQQLSNSNPP